MQPQINREKVSRLQRHAGPKAQRFANFGAVLASSTRMKRVLAVDDDRGVLETLTEALTSKGYEVVAADQAEEGLRLFKEQAFDVVLLDLHMPGKNGFELYRELGDARDVPVLFVSGYSQAFSPATPGFADLWTGQFSLGRTDVLYKPFHLSSLFDKVEALIGSAEVTTNGSR
jgi:DNA-binding response OmpR family regulator